MQGEDRRDTEQSLTTEQLARSGAEESRPVYPGEGTADSAPQGDRDAMRQEADVSDSEETSYDEEGPAPEGGPGGTGAVPQEESAAEESEALLPEQKATEYQDAWSEIQGRFVDDPQGAVRDADGLVAEVMQTLAGTFSTHKKELESQWQQGEQVATEDLRLALQRYRSFFGRLLRT